MPSQIQYHRSFWRGAPHTKLDPWLGPQVRMQTPRLQQRVSQWAVIWENSKPLDHKEQSLLYGSTSARWIWWLHRQKPNTREDPESWRGCRRICADQQWLRQLHCSELVRFWTSDQSTTHIAVPIDENIYLGTLTKDSDMSCRFNDME